MYNHNLIEKKWQAHWKQNKTYKFVESSKPKFYVLDMFPYPSGKGLHIGHAKGYTPTDVTSRFKRLNQFDVLHPMGWDAFGLPAEQYAIDTNNHPSTFTQKNIEIFRNQLQKFGFDYDYDKEVNTTDPQYYKWTQWIFVQLFKHGLAEIQEIDVNWCDKLKTTLSNEEILTNADGVRVSERGGFPVIKKPMKQWVLKITKYADRLLNDLETIDWPESLKSLQRNWIGKTEGYRFDFITENKLSISVFTTRLDTIYGVTGIVISPKHSLVQKIVTLENQKKVNEFLDSIAQKSDLSLKINNEKSGVFTGAYAVHPLTSQRLPIWISDYVLDDVGTGAIMVVPGHDARDLEFAQKFDLAIINVIDKHNKYINSELINGMNFSQAIEKLASILHADKTVNYKLKDWVFSRQRYWGEPFPIMFDENNKPCVIENLPLLLPECQDFKPNDDGQSPLAKIDSFINIEINGKKYKLDSNTMPQWAGSCWYYLAYLLKNSNNTYEPLNSSKAFETFKRWLPVDIYVGGQEHAVLHLLYARFWHKFLFDIKVVPTSEPFYKIINQGMILGPDGNKMSKSKGNIINPDEIITTHGADALRLYECFMGPLTATLKWMPEGVDGARKWLDRVYRYYYEHPKHIVNESELDEELIFTYHNFVKNFTSYINQQQFNLAVSEMMICLNMFYKYDSICNEYLETFCLALSCFAPHLGEEIWHTNLNKENSVSWQVWPKHDEAKLLRNIITIPFQINGKLKKIVKLPKDLDTTSMIEMFEALPEIALVLNDLSIIKKIVVPNKIINYLVKQ